MMAGEREAFAAAFGWPPNHVGIGPVVLEKVHVDGGEMTEGMAEISCKSDGLKKNFREKNGRAEIDINPALEFGHQ